jgi:1-hydroxycarotenoid 3,4-desaturase
MTTVVIGSGIGGLSAAIALAAAGEAVTVLERQPAAGGKLRPLTVGGDAYDGCATVMTMPWVFDELFALAQQDFRSTCTMQSLDVYARHYWSGDASLDLHADETLRRDAVAAFAGAADAESYVRFMADAKMVADNLKQPFLRSQRPTLFQLAAQTPLSQSWRVSPFDSLWSVVKRTFKDPRLVQLFTRYATYCGSSPFDAPSSLMMIAQVEAEGVWRLPGGMSQLVTVLKQQAEKLGVSFKFEVDVARVEMQGSDIGAVVDVQDEVHPCDNIVFNGDPNALAEGLLGRDLRHVAPDMAKEDRSLSALVCCGAVEVTGVPLSHHTVFFSDDYQDEFRQLERGVPIDPTVYVCDQGQLKKQFLINAPARTDVEMPHAMPLITRRLENCGAHVDWSQADMQNHGPKDFAHFYPGTSGALYGRALNSWSATFQRPQARTRIPGLYLAGGATHPGPGVPMAALSGLRAAEALISDRASTRPFRKTDTAGGMSTG